MKYDFRNYHELQRVRNVGRDLAALLLQGYRGESQIPREKVKSKKKKKSLINPTAELHIYVSHFGFLVFIQVHLKH